MSDLQNTIERDPDWPKEYKWHAYDHNGDGYIFVEKPNTILYNLNWISRNMMQVSNGTLCEVWKTSLSKIVDPVPETAKLPIPDFTGEPKRNPKHIQAQRDGKCPMEYLCYSALTAEARVLKHGADKYGVRNWRIDEILASTYEGAIMRHLLAWAMGDDSDPDSGESHLAHIRACCAIVLDAIDHGTLIDDRDRKESKG